MYVEAASTLEWLEGNITDDPQFVGSADLHLTAGSPCVDAGRSEPSDNDECFPPSLGSDRNDMGAYGGSGACCWVSEISDADGDGYLNHCFGGDDCDDANGAINPGAEEVCADGVDNNCNGQVDEQTTSPCCFLGSLV